MADPACKNARFAEGGGRFTGMPRNFARYFAE